MREVSSIMEPATGRIAEADSQRRQVSKDEFRCSNAYLLLLARLRCSRCRRRCRYVSRQKALPSCEKRCACRFNARQRQFPAFHDRQRAFAYARQVTIARTRVSIDVYIKFNARNAKAGRRHVASLFHHHAR